MNFLEQISQKRKIVIMDGAMGAHPELASANGKPDALFNLEKPGHVRQMHSEYIDAGAELIITNTGSASLPLMKKAGVANQFEAVNIAGAELAREASSDRVPVIGTLGQSDDYLKPLGGLSEKAMGEYFARQALELAKGGVDALYLEALPTLGEARIAVRACKNATDLPVIATVVFKRKSKGFATVLGTTPLRVADQLQREGADAIGSACGGEIGDLIEVASLMASSTSMPLWFRADAGQYAAVRGKRKSETLARDYAQFLGDMLDFGVSFLGGCCGTTPMHTAALVRRREKLSQFE